MNYKKFITSLLLLSMLTACKTNDSSTSINNDFMHSGENIELYAAVLKANPSSIKEEHFVKEKRLVINADVTIGEFSKLEQVKFQFDELKFQDLANTFMLELHPNASYSSISEGMHDWIAFDEDSFPSSYLSAYEQTAYVNFDDVANEPKGVPIDGVEHYFEYGYITNSQPTGLELTAEEAALLTKSFLEEYSSLSFEPWNIIAMENETAGYSGLYDIHMQSYYNGLPVCMDDDVGAGVAAKVGIYSGGICYFSGSFLWKLIEETPVEQIAPVENVIEKLKESFYIFADGDVVEINSIRLEYKPASSNGSIMLRPVWVFYADDIRTEIDNSTGMEREVSLDRRYMYYADTGTFCGYY